MFHLCRKLCLILLMPMSVTLPSIPISTNFVLGFHFGAGNIHDSQMFHEVFKKLEVFKSEIKAVAVDAGYKTPGIMREIIQRGMIPVVPYKRPMTKKGFFKKTEYVYDEYYD